MIHDYCSKITAQILLALNIIYICIIRIMLVDFTAAKKIIKRYGITWAHFYQKKKLKNGNFKLLRIHASTIKFIWKKRDFILSWEILDIIEKCNFCSYVYKAIEWTNEWMFKTSVFIASSDWTVISILGIGHKKTF